MKYSILIGIICLAIFGVLLFVTQPEYNFNFVLGATGGMGVGFLIGGIWGFLTKKTKKIIETREKIVEVMVEPKAKPKSDSNKIDGDDIA